MADQAHDIAAVLARMDEIQRESELVSGPGDGVACFNRLYRAVTEAVRDKVDEIGFFVDPRALQALDVIFADLYFSAIDAGEQQRPIPKAWKPLFEERANQRIAPIQFALAGMNAHINHDLPVALVQSWAAAGERGGVFSRLWDRIRGRNRPRVGVTHEDYLKVNAILSSVEERVKSFLENEFLRDIDRDFGKVDDVVAMWSIEHAREHAWLTATALWELRGNKTATDDLLGAVDRLVGFAGHGLLLTT
jgi:tetrahydromethanopterin S-methyltransferase subunit G